jgi:DnaJ-class molecular chaperone
MAQDPYEILGVKRDASQDEIRRAYRALAKKHHPDLNPGNKAAEEKFKAVSTAYELLSDPEKRARFDRGEIDAAGQERPERHFYRQYADTEQGAQYGPGGGFGGFGGGFEDIDLSDLFGDMMGRAGRGAGGRGRREGLKMRGDDRHYRLTVGFMDAVRGGQQRLTLPDGRTLDVTIPPGVEDGQVLRLRGQGDPGWNGGPAGDALIEISVAPHPVFRREGRDLHMELPVTVAEAVLGAKVDVPTPTGPVSLSIPRHSDAGRKLRLRGRGVPAHGGHAAGDLYATLKLVVGHPDAALEEALRAWAERPPQNPRHALMEAV